MNPKTQTSCPGSPQISRRELKTPRAPRKSFSAVSRVWVQATLNSTRKKCDSLEKAVDYWKKIADTAGFYIIFLIVYPVGWSVC